MQYEDKLVKLEKIIAGYGEMALAFSGGVDSTFLLLFSKKILGDKLIAITATGPNFAPDEIQYAKDLCLSQEVDHLLVDLSQEFLNDFAHNPPDRCYICKKSIFSGIKEACPMTIIADGTNLDDLSDYRPGQKALTELKVVSPLKEAGLTKAEIRRGLKEAGGDIWDKPAFACLASRIPYGQEITVEKLTAIYTAEKSLKDLGFKQVRLRHHGDIARIEVDPKDRVKFFDLEFMDKINKLVKEAGFAFVTLDLGGYKMGSLNQEVVNSENK
ncbi:MAG: ATP-dependent sacrificial sulfur transferase LarE [Anaerovoracaceae bacterium]